MNLRQRIAENRAFLLGNITALGYPATIEKLIAPERRALEDAVAEVQPFLASLHKAWTDSQQTQQFEDIKEKVEVDGEKKVVVVGNKQRPLPTPAEVLDAELAKL